MPARQFSVNLTDPGFPFRSDLAEQGALADEIPNQTKRRIYPKVLRVENCLPCVNGFDSLDSIAPVAGVGGRKFDKVYNFNTSLGEKALMSPSYGKAYVLEDGDTTWDDKLNLVGDSQHTIAYIRGETYFYFRNTGAYKYNAGGGTMDAVTLTGLIVANILGITAASNYTIAFDRTTIYYTSGLEVAGAIDFTPTLGVAGSLQVLAIRGDIVACLPYANGFIVYTKENAVHASYSGNPNNPFVFREIRGSAGVMGEELVAWDTNIGSHFAWTRSGLQEVTPDRAQNLFPDLLDMIRQRTMETFDTTTGVTTRTETNVDFAIKLSLIGHRFLCISYGTFNETPEEQVYEAVFVFDLDLKRWGRIVEEHVDVFMYTFTGGINFLTYNDLVATPYNDLATIRYEELTSTDPGGASLAYRIALLQLDGTIKAKSRANMAGLGTGRGSILLGGIAVRPENMTEVNEFRMAQTQMEEVKLYSSQYDDPLVTPDIVTTPVQSNVGNNLVNERFLLRATARSHSLYVSGRFHLTDMNAWLDEVGDR